MQFTIFFGLPNICLTCVAVPVGLGIKLAERSDSKFYAKGNVRSKQLLDETLLVNTHVSFRFDHM